MFLSAFCRLLLYSTHWTSSGFCPRLLPRWSFLLPFPCWWAPNSDSAQTLSLHSRLVSLVDWLPDDILECFTRHSNLPYRRLNSGYWLPALFMSLNTNHHLPRCSTQTLVIHCFVPFLPFHISYIAHPADSAFKIRPKSVYFSSPLPRSWIKTPSSSLGLMLQTPHWIPTCPALHSASSTPDGADLGNCTLDTHTPLPPKTLPQLPDPLTITFFMIRPCHDLAPPPLALGSPFADHLLSLVSFHFLKDAKLGSAI